MQIITKREILNEGAPNFPLSANWVGGNKRGQNGISAREAAYIRRDCTIRLLADFNPKRGKSTAAFAEYRNGWSVAQFCRQLLQKGVVASEKGALDHVAWDYNHKFIDLIPFVLKRDDGREIISDEPHAGETAIADLTISRPSDRALSVSYKYKRDPGIRASVLKRANGRCEFCGKLGFIDSSGQEYLESHHIIALAKQGADTMGNVIALCADHHREAHFGRDAEALEAKMSEIVREKEAVSPARVPMR